ncbi:MAG: hypothetical protein ABSG69_04855 [Candidatus Acidiferrum sp.]
MPRIHLLVFSICLALVAVTPSKAQMGMNIIQKPKITSVFHPVVGAGAVYQDTHSNAPNDPPSTQEMSVVAKESVDGKDGYWLEFSVQDKKSGGTMYAKALITKDDFAFHRMVFQQPGQQAMEMPYHPRPGDASMQKSTDTWHVIGNETITVPAGTFSCQHWSNNSGSDIWTSDKVSPFGAVKEVSPTSTMVLVKLISDAEDHITGPVKTFDPQEMQRQMMEQMQQRKQPSN